jgi:hypothetical protein
VLRNVFHVPLLYNQNQFDGNRTRGWSDSPPTSLAHKLAPDTEQKSNVAFLTLLFTDEPKTLPENPRFSVLSSTGGAFGVPLPTPPFVRFLPRAQNTKTVSGTRRRCLTPFLYFVPLRGIELLQTKPHKHFKGYFSLRN